MKSNRKPVKTPEQIYRGMAVGTGVAIGVVHRHDSRASVHVREVRVSVAKVRSEQHRLLEAAARAAGRIEALQSQAKRLEGAAGLAKLVNVNINKHTRAVYTAVL